MLNMKKFSSTEESNSPSLDLGSLENNPNYKPEDTGAETIIEPPIVDAPTTDEPIIAETIVDKPIENEEIGGKPILEDKSSLTTDNKPETQKPLEVTDEMILKNLSEKLGREVTSFDDFTQKPKELDEDIKAINEWKEKTGRPIEDFFKYQKDYSEVSDLDIAREFLQIEYPTFTKEDINLELEALMPSEDDLDGEAAKKSLDLKKLAIKGRKVLDGFKVELSKPSTENYTPEVKQKLEFADNIQKQMDANNGQQKEYADNISKVALSSEGMKLNLSDDLNIDFKISDEERKELPTLINDMPHWRNEDGSWNHKAVVDDAIKIKHFDKMLRLAYEQGQNSGKDNIIKDAKNSTLGDPKGAEQSTSKKKGTIEGIDKLLGKQSMKTRFGNK